MAHFVYQITAVSDSTWSEISKTWILGFYSTSIKIWRLGAFCAFTIAFFAAVNPLRKQKLTSTGSKGHGLWFVIGRFRSVLCVCCFWISEFLKSAVSFPALCLVDQGDLYFDVLLCDVNFAFLLKFRFPRWNCSFRRNTVKTSRYISANIWFCSFCSLFHRYLTSKDWLLW